MDSQVTWQVTVEDMVLGLGKGINLNQQLSVRIEYGGSNVSEFAGNPYPRYPMTLEMDFTDGDFLAVHFVTSDGVQETLLPPMKKTYTFTSAWDFATGLITPSAQGGKWEGIYLIQPLDNAAYPFVQAGFDPSDKAQWMNLLSSTFIMVNASWWNSLTSGLNAGDYSGVTKQISFTLTDGSGYRTKHTVYLELYVPLPV